MGMFILCPGTMLCSGVAGVAAHLLWPPPGAAATPCRHAGGTWRAAGGRKRAHASVYYVLCIPVNVCVRGRVLSLSVL
jgi:hypothetical protein